jgi:hypothetical protein
MKKILLMILAVISFICCEPVEVTNPDNDIPTSENTEQNDDNLGGSLEDPVENPEMDW